MSATDLVQQIPIIIPDFTRLPFSEKRSMVEHFPLFVAAASELHEQWRKGFDPTISGKPRIKKNSDETEGNINVPFDQLHMDWKKENLMAGVAAYRAVTQFPNDDKFQEELKKENKTGNYIHDEWMSRNPKESWNDHQHVDYNDLSQTEKDKDRVQARFMRELIKTVPLLEERTINKVMGQIGVLGGRKRNTKRRRSRRRV